MFSKFTEAVLALFQIKLTLFLKLRLSFIVTVELWRLLLNRDINQYETVHVKVLH